MPLAKSVLIPLGLTALAAGSGIHEKTLGFGASGSGATLIISNEKIKDIMKIVKSLEVSGLLIKSITQTIENETKEQRFGFLGVLLCTLCAGLLGIC